jgi:hypothetical protein
MSKKGIKDLLDEKRYTQKHIQQALVKEQVPGNWLSSQNVYNLINGNTVPRDGYVYIFLSDFLGEDIRKILSRYTKKVTRYATIDSDLF